MKQKNPEEKAKQKKSKKDKFKLYKPKKKKSSEEDGAIQYLQAQYDKVILLIFYFLSLY